MYCQRSSTRKIIKLADRVCALVRLALGNACGIVVWSPIGFSIRPALQCDEISFSNSKFTRARTPNARCTRDFALYGFGDEEIRIGRDRHNDRAGVVAPLTERFKRFPFCSQVRKFLGDCESAVGRRERVGLLCGDHPRSCFQTRCSI